MNPLKLYGSILSPPTRSVIEFCKLSSINFNFININAQKGDHKTPEYKKLNPFCKFPVIVHNGFNVWESPSIVVYLADAFNINTNWYPKDIKTRARINSYLHWHHENVRSPLAGYVRGKVLGPVFYAYPELDEENDKRLKDKMLNCIRELSDIIDGNGFIARTEGLSIADIFAFNEIFNTKFVKLGLDEYPKLKSWFMSIEEIEEIRDTNDGIIEGFYKFADSIKNKENR